MSSQIPSRGTYLARSVGGSGKRELADGLPVHHRL